MEQKTIEVKYHSDKIQKLEGAGRIGDWIDLRCAEDILLHQGEYALINLGVSMKLPEGYEALLIPRSSAFKNFGIIQANSIGLLDESYCGDNDVWRMPVYAVRDTQISVNDRICQFRIIKHQPAVKFREVGSLGMPDRGGLGSTGIQ